MPKPNAFATLVMLSDSYVPGALVLAHQLERLSPGIDRICMVTEHLSDNALRLLSHFYTRIHRVQPWHLKNPDAQRHDWPWLFTKLEALTLTEYHKVLLIDADILPLADYRSLLALNAPAGILNECKRHFVAASQRRPHLLAWHDAYDGLCPHGSSIPQEITDRVARDSSNLGVNSCLWLLSPSSEEHQSVRESLESPENLALIRNLPLPEMQFMTYLWSGRWHNIDIRYAAFNAQPALEAVWGTHFAGIKPWQWQRGKSFVHYSRLPDYQLWHSLFRQVYWSLPKDFQRDSRLSKLMSALDGPALSRRK